MMIRQTSIIRARDASHQGSFSPIPVVSLDSEACRHKTRTTTHARNIDTNRHMMANKPV
jgi:hypothetical protein